MATQVLYAPSGTTWTSAAGDVVTENGASVEIDDESINALRLGELLTWRQASYRSFRPDPGEGLALLVDGAGQYLVSATGDYLYGRA